MSAVYALKRSQTACIISMVCEQPAVTNEKVPYLLQLEAPVSATVADSGSNPAFGYLYEVHEDIQFSGIFMRI